MAMRLKDAIEDKIAEFNASLTNPEFVDPRAIRAAERVCNCFSTMYWDVAGTAGNWGEKHVDDVARIIQEECFRE